MIWWYIGAAVIGGLVASYLTPEMKTGTGQNGQDLTKPATDKFIKVRYGTRGAVTGNIAWMKTNDQDDDDIKNDLLHIWIVWNEGGIKSIPDLYLDDVSINHNKWGGFAHARHFENGTNGTYTDTTLANTGFVPSEMRFDDLAVSYVRLELDGKNNFSGQPNITADIEGRLCVTNKTLGTSLTTISESGVIQLYDYLINDVFGKGLEDEDINNSSFMSAEVVRSREVYDYQGASTTRPQFTSNIELDTGKSVMDNVTELLKTMRGRIFDVDGKLNLVLEDDHTPVDALIAGQHFNSEDVSFEFPDQNSTYNRVVATYIDPDANWQKQDVIWPETNSAEDLAFQAEDGGIVENGQVLKRIDRPLRITFDGCTNYYEARANGRVMVQTSRENLTATIICDPEALKYLPGDIIPVTDPLNGWNGKLFRAEEVELYSDGQVGLELVEHQSYIYTYTDANPKPAIPDTNFIDPSIVSKPTGLDVETNGNGNSIFTWNSDLKQFYYFVKYDDEIISEGPRSTNSVSIDPLSAGEYEFGVCAINTIGYQSEYSIRTFTLTAPVAPTLKINKDAINIVIQPEITGSYFNTTFELVFGLVDDVESEENTNYGQASNWTIPGLSPNTDHYIFVRTINLIGQSVWATTSVKTDATAPNIVDAINGQITFENFAQESKDVIEQVQRDIESNTDSNTATKNALQTLNQKTISSSNNFVSTLEAVGSALLADADNIDRVNGLASIVNQTANSLSIQQTLIEQKADATTIQALKVELTGKIQQIVAGDIDALVEAVIGDIEGTVNLLKVFVGEDNLTGEQTISSLVDQIIFGKNFATISHVSERITALGIENLVAKTTFDPLLATVETHTEVLQSNKFRRSLTSYSSLYNAQQAIGINLVELEAQRILMAAGQIEFKGSLASSNQLIETKTTETTALITEQQTNLARVNERVSISDQVLNNVVNESQVLAEKAEELSAADGQVLAQAQEYAAARIGYCVDEDGNITSETDAVACVAAGGSWLNMPLSEAMDYVSVTVKDAQGNDVKIKAGTLFQAFNDEWDGLLARAFFGVTSGENTTGITVTQNEDGSISSITFKGAVLNWQDSEGNGLLSLNTETKKLSIDGTLELTNAQKEELKGADGTNGINGQDGANGVDGQNGTDGADGADGINGIDGKNAAGDYTWIDATYNGTWSNSAANSYFTSTIGRSPLIGDRLTRTNNNATTPNVTTKVRNGNGVNDWGTPTVLVDGSLVARGSISADALVADAISGKKGVFGDTTTSGKNAVRLNQNNMPIWFGPNSVTENSISKSNATWFLDEDGQYKRDVSGGSALNAFTNVGTGAVKTTSTVSHYALGSNNYELTVNLQLYFDNGTADDTSQHFRGALTVTVDFYYEGTSSPKSTKTVKVPYQGWKEVVGTKPSDPDYFAVSGTTLQTSVSITVIESTSSKRFTTLSPYAKVTITDNSGFMASCSGETAELDINFKTIEIAG